MRRTLMVLTTLWLMSAGVSAGADVPGDLTERIKKLNERMAKLSTGTPGEYAQEQLAFARAGIMAARAASLSGNEKEAEQRLEMAALQMTVAEVKSAEKELAEETAVRRMELKKLESQIERYFQGGE